MDNGAIDTAEAVEAHVKDKKIPFIVIHDDKGMTVRKYQVRAFPMAYLIGADGKVIWNGHPNIGIVEDLEKKIEQAIEDAKNYAEANPEGGTDADDADENETDDEDDDG